MPLPATGAKRGLSLRRCNNFKMPEKTEEDLESDAQKRKAVGKAAKDPAIKKLVADKGTVPQLDKSDVRPNKPEDFFLTTVNGQVVVLPAADLFYELLIKPQEIPNQNIFGVPTVGKEGLRLVNIGGREAILIESGGTPVALMPEALRLIKAALNVDKIVALNTLHIHKDHIRNLEDFIVLNQIKPEGLRFPREFTKSGRDFAKIIERLRNTTTPELVKLGFGRGAATPFSMWDVPGNARFASYQVGDVRFDEFGIPAAFKTVAGGKAKNNEIDEASTLLRITDVPSGVRVLVVGDPRGEALDKLRAEMGDRAYGEMFEGVTVLSGIQHHTGVLSSAKDRAGIEQLLIEILSRNGELTVVEQSKMTFHGGRGPRIPYMNASLVEALRQLGITHKAALEPTENQPKTLGTIKVDRTGAVSAVGSSIAESLGEPEVAARFQTYTKLDRAVRTLRTFQAILKTESGTKSIGDFIAELDASRIDLGRALGLLPRANGERSGLIQSALAGVGTGTAQARPALTNQSDVDAKKADAKLRVGAETTVENEEFSKFVEMLDTQGPLLLRANRHLEEMRKTGEVTEELIRDLILLNPELASRLLKSAPMNPASRSILEGEIEKANLSGARASYPKTAGVLIALQLWNDIIGPAWALHRQAKETTRNKFLNLILWWQQRGVVPKIDAADNSWFARDTRTRDPRVVSEMIRQNKIDYLVLEKIEGDHNWDRFNLWMAMHVLNIDDFNTLIREKPEQWCSALRMKPGGDGSQWEYRSGDLSAGTIYDYNVTERWLSDPRLDIIMKSTIARIQGTTDKQLADAWTNRATAKKAPDHPSMVDPDSYTPQQMLANRVPQRRVRFKPNASDRGAYTVAEKSYVIGHIQVVQASDWKDPTFYVFDNGADPLNADEIGASYLLVTGADYETYLHLSSVMELRWRGNGPNLKVLNKIAGNQTDFVLIKKDSVVDF
ncbi:MAG: hypothetical protein ABI704_23695 [Kofleriaceae bacterium]